MHYCSGLSHVRKKNRMLLGFFFFFKCRIFSNIHSPWSVIFLHYSLKPKIAIFANVCDFGIFVPLRFMGIIIFQSSLTPLPTAWKRVWLKTIFSKLLNFASNCFRIPVISLIYSPFAMHYGLFNVLSEDEKSFLNFICEMRKRFLSFSNVTSGCIK